MTNIRDQFMEELGKAEDKGIGFTIVGGVGGFEFDMSLDWDKIEWRPIENGIEIYISYLTSALTFDFSKTEVTAEMDGESRVWTLQKGADSIILLSFLSDPR